MDESLRPSCILCRHFRYTWSPPVDKECAAYGFRSRQYPSRVVESESGRECTLFEPRPTTGPEPRTRSARPRTLG